MSQLGVSVSVNHKFELLHRILNFCSFINVNNQNFITSVLINHIMTTVNPGLLKCPIKKGSYQATEGRIKAKREVMGLPSFVISGQEINFLLVFTSVINRKLETICSVTLDLIVFWTTSTRAIFFLKSGWSIKKISSTVLH